MYESIKAKNEAYYKKDGLLVLINRLHGNVIRSGLKKINLSYSQISFEDIRTKLKLNKDQDIGLIVAKVVSSKICE